MLLACRCSPPEAPDVQPSMRRPLRTFLGALAIGVVMVAIVLLIVYTRGR